MRKPSESEIQVALTAMTGVAVGAAAIAVAGYAAFRVPKHLKKYIPAKTK